MKEILEAKLEELNLFTIKKNFVKVVENNTENLSFSNNIEFLASSNDATLYQKRPNYVFGI